MFKLSLRDSTRVIFGARPFRFLPIALSVLFLANTATASEVIPRSVPVTGGGTLNYEIDIGDLQFCNTSSGTAYWQVFNYTKFVYADSTGATHPMNGGIYDRTLRGPGAGGSGGCPIGGDDGEHDQEHTVLTSQDNSGDSIDFSLYGIYFRPMGDATATFSGDILPNYYVLSLIYAPPGNSSNSGYTDQTSTGTTETDANTFTKSSTVTTVASGEILGVAKVSTGLSVGISKADGSSSSNQQSYQVSLGNQIQSNRNPVDHTQDVFYIWLNPQVTLSVVGTSTTALEQLGTPIGANGLPEPMDVVNIVAADLMNPSQIPLSVLLPQTPRPGITLPGLAKICAHPLPPAQCTQDNACGCVASDFAKIVADDPLIGTGQITQPNELDSSRYVYVNTLSLQGPQCPGCDPSGHSYNVTDSSLQSVTESSSDSHSVGFSFGRRYGFKLFGSGGEISITDASQFVWTRTKSYGTSNGSAHTQAVTLGSKSVYCSENINVYEDTIYHTFAFAPIFNPPAQCL